MLEGIELTATMENKARTSYKAVYDYCINQSLLVDFMPQGSFLTGTVIKPYREDENDEYNFYDIDILCLYSENSDLGQDPKEIKQTLGNIIKRNEIYKEKLEEEYDKCWTLRYNEVNNYRFKLDLVPAINNLINIYITNRDGDGSYSWKKSDSLKFGEWFLGISNRSMSLAFMEEQTIKIKKELKFEDSLKEIPKYYYQSYLQKAVKILKRNRDIFYSRKANENIIRPSSMIMCTLAAEAIENETISSIEEALTKTIRYVKTKFKDFDIKNPVCSQENLCEEWTILDKETFKEWILLFEKDFLLTNDLKEFEANVKTGINESFNLNLIQDYNEVKEVKPWMV